MRADPNENDRQAVPRGRAVTVPEAELRKTDAGLIQQAGNTPFDRFMGPSAGIRVVYYVVGHTWDIYGQMVVYLRLNGITPSC